MTVIEIVRHIENGTIHGAHEFRYLSGIVAFEQPGTDPAVKPCRVRQGLNKYPRLNPETLNHVF
jgi:hypothetical protein